MYRFEPRGIGRIIDDAVDLYRANARTTIIGAALVLFPAALVAALAQVFYFRGLFGLFSTIASQAGSSEPPVDALNRFQLSSVVAVAVVPAYALVRRYYDAALLTAAPGWLAGRRVEPREFIRDGRHRVVMLVIVSLIVGLLTQVATVFLLVPGLLVAIALSLATTVVVVEDAPIDVAFRRSMTLTRGNYRRVIGFYLAVALVVVALESAVNSPSAIRQVVQAVQAPESIFAELSVGWKVFEGLLAAASTAFVLPLSGLAWFLFYLDLRCRNEGMDLLARAHALTAEQTPGAPAPAASAAVPEAPAGEPLTEAT